MPIFNGGFEDAGAAPGEAAHWTLRTSVAREGIAGFGPAPFVGWDDLERWFGWLGALDDASPTVAVFEPRREALESFEGGWRNDHFADALPLGEMVVAAFAGRDVEDLEVGWSAGPFLETWSAVTTALARFDAEREEDFSEGWRGNELFEWSWSGVTSAPAVFDGADAAESFERSWPLITI